MFKTRINFPNSYLYDCKKLLRSAGWCIGKKTQNYIINKLTEEVS